MFKSFKRLIRFSSANTCSVGAKIGVVSCVAIILLGGSWSVGAFQPQAALSTGIYFIHSDYLNDNRCVDLRTQDNETVQLYFCNGGKSEKFRVTQTANGTYTIAAVTGASNSALGLQNQQDGGGWVRAVHSCVGCGGVTWKIQKAAGSAAGSQSMNIVVAGGLTDNSAPVRPISLSGLVWNRRDPDNQGRVQLVNQSQPDPHNDFSFQSTQ